MKTILISVVILISQLAIADAPACTGEAQIIAKVDQIISRDMSECVVSIDAKSIVQYNVNRTCPLELSEVLEKGVEVGLSNGHDCNYNPGDDISGVIVRTAWDTLVLE